MPDHTFCLQLLQENYGIPLKADPSDDGGPQQLCQPLGPGETSAGFTDAAATFTECMQQQALQADLSSVQRIEPSSQSSGIHDPSAQSGSALHAQPAPGQEDNLEDIESQGGRWMPEDTSRSNRQKQATSKSSSKGAQDPAAGALNRATGKQEQQESPEKLSADPGTQGKSELPPHAHMAAKMPLAAQVPDSAAMDCSTLQELTVLPAANGHIPVGVTSPVPLAAARTKKVGGTGRPASTAAGAPPTGLARRSPYREAQQVMTGRSPAGRTPQQVQQAGTWAQKNPAAAGGPRAPQPPARKQLHFAGRSQGDAAEKPLTGRSDSTNGHGAQHAQRTQKAQAGAAPAQGRAAAAAAAKQAARQTASRQPETIKHSRAASSDSDTPRSAAARLPAPVQQDAYNPLFDPRREAKQLAGPSQQPVSALGMGMVASQSNRGAGLAHVPAWEQAAAAVRSGLSEAPRHAQQHHEELHVRAFSYQCCCTCCLLELYPMISYKQCLQYMPRFIYPLRPGNCTYCILPTHVMSVSVLKHCVPLAGCGALDGTAGSHDSSHGSFRLGCQRSKRCNGSLSLPARVVPVQQLPLYATYAASCSCHSASQPTTVCSSCPTALRGASEHL